MLKFCIEKKAFTLAEILINLFIIGIVFAILVPNILKSVQETKYRLAYKNAYSVLVHVWNQVYSDKNISHRDYYNDEDANFSNFKYFMSKFQVAKTCKGAYGIPLSECWSKNENSKVIFNFPFVATNEKELCFIDSTGISWCNTNPYGIILVDTNGMSPPNKFGYDRFPFTTCVPGDSPDGMGMCIQPGFPTVIKNWTNWKFKSEIACPSGATHHCDYSSWLLN